MGVERGKQSAPPTCLAAGGSPGQVPDGGEMSRRTIRGLQCRQPTPAPTRPAPAQVVSNPFVEFDGHVRGGSRLVCFILKRRPLQIVEACVGKVSAKVNLEIARWVSKVMYHL